MKKLAFLLATASAASCAAPALAAETISYGYDARGRLVSVARTGTVNDGATTSYTFDKADNHLAVQTTGVPADFVVVPLNELVLIPIRPIP